MRDENNLIREPLFLLTSNQLNQRGHKSWVFDIGYEKQRLVILKPNFGYIHFRIEKDGDDVHIVNEEMDDKPDLTLKYYEYMTKVKMDDTIVDKLVKKLMSRYL